MSILSQNEWNLGELSTFVMTDSGRPEAFCASRLLSSRGPELGLGVRSLNKKVARSCSASTGSYGL